MLTFLVGSISNTSSMNRLSLPSLLSSHLDSFPFSKEKGIKNELECVLYVYKLHKECKQDVVQKHIKRNYL